MNKTQQRTETREHLLATGEQLCLQRGFTGMGLSELLTLAEVPKGSFYYYFRSKEAFGVALLERYFLHLHQQVEARLQRGEGTPRERLLAHFRQAERLFSEQGHIVGCLAVKLSAEVCDLSEPMRDALQRGASRIIAVYTAEVIYILWLGASLQSKLSREPQPLRLALSTLEQWLQIR